MIQQPAYVKVNIVYGSVIVRYGVLYLPGWKIIVEDKAASFYLSINFIKSMFSCIIRVKHVIIWRRRSVWPVQAHIMQIQEEFPVFYSVYCFYRKIGQGFLRHCFITRLENFFDVSFYFGFYAPANKVKFIESPF